LKSDSKRKLIIIKSGIIPFLIEKLHTKKNDSVSDSALMLFRILKSEIDDFEEIIDTLIELAHV
jgi:midasin (ATPase involved in ribosome maturation)